MPIHDKHLQPHARQCCSSWCDHAGVLHTFNMQSKRAVVPQVRSHVSAEFLRNALEQPDDAKGLRFLHGSFY